MEHPVGRTRDTHLHDLALGQVKRPEAHARNNEEEEEGPYGPVAGGGILGEKAIGQGCEVELTIG
jgi:hypothetical protein